MCRAISRAKLTNERSEWKKGNPLLAPLVFPTIQYVLNASRRVLFLPCIGVYYFTAGAATRSARIIRDLRGRASGARRKSAYAM